MAVKLPEGTCKGNVPAQISHVSTLYHLEQFPKQIDFDILIGLHEVFQEMGSYPWLRDSQECLV